MHICQDGKYAYEVSDTVKGLKGFIRKINKHSFKIDMLCITGDLSDDGSISSYEIVRESLEQLTIPYYLVPGNHDNKENMAVVFEDHKYLNSYVDNRILYSFIHKGVKIILLDSVSPGSPDGSLTEGVLTALENELISNYNTIIFMHQPPFPSGIGFMDNQSYLNKDKFLNIVEKNKNIMLVACGHIHRQIFTKKSNVNFIVAPSTAMQLDLNLNDTAPGDFVLETPGYLIHRIDTSNSDSPDILSYGVQITNKKEMEITYPFND